MEDMQMNERLRINQLDKQIKKQIRNLCAADYSDYQLVEDFPFFAFHVWFKKAVLETLAVDAMKSGELSSTDFEECLSLFPETKRIKDIKSVKIEHFKCNKEYCSKFNISLFVEYTDQLTQLLVKKTKYQELVECLCVFSKRTHGEIFPINYIIEEIAKDTYSINEEILSSEIENADDYPNEYRWREYIEQDKKGNEFYVLNSEVYRLFFKSKRILGIYSETDEACDCDLTSKESKAEYLKLLNSNKKTIDDEVNILLLYYKTMVEVLTHKYFNLDLNLVSNILEITLIGLIKRQLNLTIYSALNNKKGITIKDLALQCGSTSETLQNQLYILESPVLPLLHLCNISTILEVSIDKLLELPKPEISNTINTEADYNRKPDVENQ